EAGGGEDRNGRRGDPCSVTPRDGDRRDDPSTDHDAAGAGIGELARSQRLQSGDVRNLVRRDHNTGGASIHDGSVAATAKRDAQKRRGAGTRRIHIGKISSLIIFLIAAGGTGRSTYRAEQKSDAQRGWQNRRKGQGQSQCQYGGEAEGGGPAPPPRREAGATQPRPPPPPTSSGATPH